MVIEKKQTKFSIKKRESAGPIRGSEYYQKYRFKLTLRSSKSQKNKYLITKDVPEYP